MNVITERYSLYCGDCLEVMKTFPDNSYDSIITDPPYMLDFMGKAFDTSKDNIAARVELWQECLRVAKPGAHLLAFGGDRTHHRLMVAIEDAGWEIRTCIYWLFGSGFPKALNISKAIDEHLGAEREVIGNYRPPDGRERPNSYRSTGNTYGEHGGPLETPITAPASDAAKEFSGWFSGLKPAAEIIIVAMKPLTSTFAANALAHGVAGLNIDGCRVASNGEDLSRPIGYGGIGCQQLGNIPPGTRNDNHPAGRWPSNLILDQQAADLLDEMSGESKSSGIYTVHQHNDTGTGFIGKANRPDNHKMYDDTGGASRYFTVLPDSEPRIFYSSKASRAEREEGLDGLQPSDASVGDRRPSGSMSQRIHADEGRPDTVARNFHPTVKPLELMRWLVRLTKTPTGGVVLDPFGGSGTTVIACLLENRHCTYIDKEPDYFEITTHRAEHWQEEADTAPRKLRGSANDLADMPLFAEIQGG